MAKANVAATANQVFRPFTWVKDDLCTHDVNILAMAKDVSSGIATVLELIERAELDDDNDTAYLNGYHRGALQRLAITSCHLLGGESDRRFASIQRNDSNGGAK